MAVTAGRYSRYFPVVVYISFINGWTVELLV